MPATTTRMGLRYPLGSEAPDGPLDLQELASDVDSQAAIYGQGTLGARPVSSGGSPGKQGRYYVATDLAPKIVYYDYGTGWQVVGASRAGTFGSLPTPTADLAGLHYVATDVDGGALYRCDGTVWTQIAAGLTHAARHLPSANDPIDWVGSVNKSGLYAARPSASAANAGLTYFATDTMGLFRSTGSAWVLIAQGSPLLTVAQFAALLTAITTPYDGQKFTLTDSLSAPTYRFPFYYNAASANTAKWEGIGGTYAQVSLATSQALVTRSAWTDPATVGPDWVTPRQGDWEFQARALFVVTAPGAGTCNTFCQVGVTNPASSGSLFAPPGTHQGHQVSAEVSSNSTQTIGTAAAQASGNTLRVRYLADPDALTVNVADRVLFVRPIRIS